MRTDKQIIKEFEEVLEDNHMSIINQMICGDVLDIINRQQAEIERLKKELEQSEQSGDILETILEEKNADISELIFKERDNAVREFADMLKQYADNYGSGDDFIAVSVIDDVMKDMTRSDDE